jgi:hypothetical protein
MFESALVTPNVFRAVFIAVVVLVWQFGSSVLAQPTVATPKTAKADDLDALVDALANHNVAPPILVNSSVGDINDPPIFPENSDWAENRRVRDAIIFLGKRNGEALWPHLLKHMRDDRYSLTCDSNGDGSNMTVGWFCTLMVRQDLEKPYASLWQTVVPHRGPPFPGALIGFAWPGWWNATDEWARSRKTLWELQVELGERGLRRINGQKTEVLDKTRETIEKIRQTKKPILSGRHWPFGELAIPITEQRAKEIRDKYRARAITEPVKNNGDTRR